MDVKKLYSTSTVVMLSVIVSFAMVFYRLYNEGWKYADYQHGIFILPIALYFLWAKRKELVIAPRMSGVSMVVFGVGIVLFIVGSLTSFMFMQAGSFCLVVWGIYLARYEWESCKKVLFPLAYLLFLIPPPGLVIDAVTMPMKEMSTTLSYYVLKVLQLPVEQFGVVIRIAQHDLFISDACSGFRSMSTLLALGSVYAYVQKTSVARKWCIFLSIIPIALGANIFRIVLTGLIVHFIGVKFGEGFYHEASGIVLFIVATIGLMTVGEVIGKTKMGVRS